MCNYFFSLSYVNWHVFRNIQGIKSHINSSRKNHRRNIYNVCYCYIYTFAHAEIKMCFLDLHKTAISGLETFLFQRGGSYMTFQFPRDEYLFIFLYQWSWELGVILCQHLLPGRQWRSMWTPWVEWRSNDPNQDSQYWLMGNIYRPYCMSTSRLQHFCL